MTYSFKVSILSLVILNSIVKCSTLTTTLSSRAVFSLLVFSFTLFLNLSIIPIIKTYFYNSKANFFSYMLNNIKPIPNNVNANAAKYANVDKSGRIP